MDVIDRRALVAGAAAMAAGAGWSRPAPSPEPASGKARMIDAVLLPPDFNGVLAYGRAGRVEHLRCVGMADVEAGVGVTSATSYKWGSASKWLTSVAVLRLVEQGHLDLDAPMLRYLPEFRRDAGERVLLRHLLSNTSGIPDLFSQAVATEPALRTSTASAEAIVARFGGGDLRFAPGEGWDYAALNWVIIAAIMERVTGARFPELVRRLVLRPLRMAGAGFAQADEPAMPALAAAYDSSPAHRRKMAPVPPCMAASGNVAGTVEDAMRAAHGIFHGPLLGAASRRALTTVRWPGQEYALGGRVHPIDGEPWAWETGKVQGYRAHIAHRLARSETVVVFNTTDMEQSAITAWVEGIARA